MPYCEVGKYQNDVDANCNNGTKIFYRTYGQGPIKVLLIIGLAGTHNSWDPQIKALAGTITPNDAESPASDRSSGEGGGGVEVCAFDNRGMGLSSVPTKKSEYTTSIMAKDAIAVMDHLGWEKAHIFGHSMGAMIACKLAAMVPERVLSLALLNVTGGGYECIPRLTENKRTEDILLIEITCGHSAILAFSSFTTWHQWSCYESSKVEIGICILQAHWDLIDRQTLSIAVRFLKAKTPEQRAAVDLDTHYSKEYLEEDVGTTTRRAVLYQEYVKGISASGMQSNCGFDGQINACWSHKLSRADLESICSAGFLISVIHGRHDVIAQLGHAKRLAKKLYPYARMVELPGGHLVSHERTEEVNDALLELIKASTSKISLYDWTNLPKKTSGWNMTPLSRKSSPEGSRSSVVVDIVGSLQMFLMFFFGLFMLAYEFMRRGVSRLNPVRVNAALT
ncbi:putative aminoacrylate hydrolase RutD-like isoform 2 [Capsicum annuum]|nr:putative aminoacrylate hydrolase RutD-like isoform 2 [Capsicum annuum]